MHDGFLESGFLSQGTRDGVGGVRAANAAWFGLCDDVNAVLMRVTATAMEVPAARGITMLPRYLNYMRLSEDSAHPSATSLHKHVEVRDDRSGWSYKAGPAGQTTSRPPCAARSSPCSRSG